MRKELRKKLLLLLGIALALSMQIIFNTYEKQENMICRVMAETSISKAWGEFAVTANLPKKYMTEKDIEGMLRHICGLAGVEKKECEISSKEGCWYGGGASESVSVKITTSEFNTGEETVVNMEFTSAANEYVSKAGKIIDLQNNILDFCEKEDMEVNVYSLVLGGSYLGCLSDDYIEKNTKEIYKKLGGACIDEKHVDGRYISYGYTPLVGNYIVTQKDKVNLNIVYTYDEEKNETKIYLATPIINTQY